MRKYYAYPHMANAICGYAADNGGEVREQSRKNWKRRFEMKKEVDGIVVLHRGTENAVVMSCCPSALSILR